jgi:signal transduction histidine kinase
VVADGDRRQAEHDPDDQHGKVPGRAVAGLSSGAVDNAVRHNEPGGWIRVRTGSRDAAVYLEIANSGPLVPDDAVPSLFEPFRRMQGRTGVRDGVGRGLSIARSVVTAHRATVTARSQPAGGLHISVVIPRCLDARPPETLT